MGVGVAGARENLDDWADHQQLREAGHMVCLGKVAYWVAGFATPSVLVLHRE